VSEHTTDLKPCPSCGFSRAKYDEHAQTMQPNVIGPWDSYCPEFLPILGVWFISCQNCGFVAAWDNNTKADAVRNWNRLPRRDEVQP